jgi:hypothetical protein
MEGSLMMELLLTIVVIFLPPVLFVGFIVLLVQAAPYLCDECHGSPWNMYAGKICGCGNGINPHQKWMREDREKAERLREQRTTFWNARRSL